MLLRGLADSWRAPRVRVIVPSQRGHGDADRPAAGYAPEGFADDLTGLLDAAGVGAAVIAGHSSAALVAMRFALNRPDRTLGLVLVGGFPALPAAVVKEVDPILSALADPVEEGSSARSRRGPWPGRRRRDSSTPW